MINYDEVMCVALLSSALEIRLKNIFSRVGRKTRRSTSEFFRYESSIQNKCLLDLTNTFCAVFSTYSRSFIVLSLYRHVDWLWMCVYFRNTEAPMIEMPLVKQ